MVQSVLGQVEPFRLREPYVEANAVNGTQDDWSESLDQLHNRPFVGSLHKVALDSIDL